jgi:hypothetical protein
MDAKERDMLEAFIDGYGLARVLECLTNICHAKATHIAVNWQDAPLAQIWIKAGMRIDVVRRWCKGIPALHVDRPYPDNMAREEGPVGEGEREELINDRLANERYKD